MSSEHQSTGPDTGSLNPAKRKMSHGAAKNWFAINTTTGAWWTAASLRKLSASRCQDINIYQNKMTARRVGRHRTVEELQDTHSDTLSVDLVLTGYALWSLRNLADRIKCSTCEWHKFHMSIWGRLPVGRQPVMFKWTRPKLVWVRLKDLFHQEKIFCWCYLSLKLLSHSVKAAFYCSINAYFFSTAGQKFAVVSCFFACCYSWFAFKGSLLILSCFDPTYNEVDGRF